MFAYAGEVEATHFNGLGRVLAQLLRLVGSPLPLDAGNAGAPAFVTVTEDAAGAGQFWTRQYGRPNGRFPQTVRSTKRFTGPTGCEEWVTRWLGMSLNVRVEDGALYFDSQRYLLKLFGRSVALPTWLTPGRLRVGHRAIGDTAFRFTLELIHPLFGPLLHQSILFRDLEDNR